MSAQRGRGRGLAGQMVAATLAAAVLAVSGIGLVSLWGVYGLHRSEDSSLLSTSRTLAADSIAAHLRLTRQVLDSLGSLSTARAEGAGAMQAALDAAVASGDGHLLALAVVDDTGHIVAASRGSVLPPSFAGAGFFESGKTRPHTWYAWSRWPKDAAVPALWAVRSLGGVGPRRALVGRLTLTFMSQPLQTIVSGTHFRSALIVGPEGAMVLATPGGVPVDPKRFTFVAAEDASSGSVEAPGGFPTGSEMGVYRSLDAAAPELQWRLVLLESDQEALSRSLDALYPAVLATIIVTLVTVLGALLYSRRVIAPLSQLERRAHEIAAGGYMRPLVVDRADELGRLADAFNQVGVRLNSLQDMARLLASAADSREVREAVIAAIEHLLGTRQVAVLLAVPGAGLMRLAGGHGLRTPDVELLVPADDASVLAEAFLGRCEIPFSTGEGEAVRAVRELFGADDGRTGIVMPLLAGEEILGVVVAVAVGRQSMTQGQIETLRAFSAQAAVAIRTAELFEQEHVSRREAEALGEAGEIIARTRDVEATITRVAGIAASLLGADFGSVALEQRDEFGLVPDPDRVTTAALLRRWRAVVGDGDAVSLFAQGDPLEGGSLPHRVLLVPLLRGERFCGVLALGAPDAGDYDQRELRLAQTFGKQIALALDNAALMHEALAHAKNLETIFLISQAVSSSLQINVVLNRVLDVVQKIFSADAVSLMGYDPLNRVIKTSMVRGVSNRDMLHLQVASGEDIPGTVFRDGEPIGHPDLTKVDTPLARLAASQGFRSVLAVPLLARGRSRGVLTVYDQRMDAFSKEDTELLVTFATQAALAIDTAELYGREHHVASVLQQSILPERLPQAPHLETGSFYLPAALEAEIGGDYYDLFLTPEGTAVIVIADVCGKGVKAATKTSMIKYTMRGLVAAGAGPATAMTELNRLVLNTGDPSDIVTAWVGFLSEDRRTLLYANAGHPAALLHRAASGQIVDLETTGPLLGAVEGVAFEERSVDVASGDLLLTYTDGVTEARRGREFFGDEPIRAVMREAHTAGEAVDGLLDALARFTSGAMRDDAAVLAVRVTSEPDP